MQIGKVVGSIVSTQKDESLVGKKLMIVKIINSDEQESDREEVAVDTVGAGIGEYVLLTRGSAARNIFPNGVNAIDASIVGIIDSFEK
ncbi:EutN/CcmL family microcompartment protein [Desemzia sp. C1]|uniref:EutN/CcmL family microcompartment protein n=1 Tax=Desemzia sp. C1 TaxID=2892016 RepID=UPI001E604141|nr:EutN/CcmL family microcompartment protein [Desemzia sp. C1]MCI3029306.1 EutN/CcmL family microcompartment protein [Desemzia sp. C1]